MFVLNTRLMEVAEILQPVAFTKLRQDKLMFLDVKSTKEAEILQPLTLMS